MYSIVALFSLFAIAEAGRDYSRGRYDDQYHDRDDDYYTAGSGKRESEESGMSWLTIALVLFGVAALAVLTCLISIVGWSVR